MTLAELMADPVWAAKTDAQVVSDLLSTVTIPVSEVHVSAHTLEAMVPIAEMTAWRKVDDVTASDLKTAYERFTAIVNSGGTVRGDRVIEQATALRSASIISQVTRDAVVALTVRTRTKADELGIIGAISEYLVAEARNG